MSIRVLCFSALALLGASPPASAGGAGPELIEPGAIAPLPSKGVLPRREGVLNLTAGGGLLLGEGLTGGEAFGSLRLAEAVGVGVGVLAGSEVAAFIRMDAIGLAINHWAFLGYADYVIGGRWRFGGAMVAPIRRDTYLRLSIAADLDGGAGFGLGLEHDLW